MNDRELDEIVLLFLDPEQIFIDGSVQLSPLLRKLYAQYSCMHNSHGAERGVKPTVREVRRGVERKGGRWPWVAVESPDADVQALRTARKSLKANRFCDKKWKAARQRCKADQQHAYEISDDVAAAPASADIRRAHEA